MKIIFLKKKIKILRKKLDFLFPNNQNIKTIVNKNLFFKLKALTGGIMNEKKLRKASKTELLELLLEQQERIVELEKKLELAEKKLKSKKILLEESGSIAEASLKLNDIFTASQSAADTYLLNVKEKCKKMELETKKECERMLKETSDACNEKKEEKSTKKNRKTRKTKIVLKETNAIKKGEQI